MTTQRAISLWDRPLTSVLRLDAEKAAYLAIFLLALVSRFWDLGARAMSFDECTHALYAYHLYRGEGFVHNPLMHGPFLFHANALVYFLLGDSDYTARIVPALFGVFLVMSPLLLRRWLGRAGALLASVLLLISPSFLFYSRYIRNDVYIAVWTVLLTAALFHFLADRKPAWLYLGAAVLMLSLATKENAYFFGYFGLVFLVELAVWEQMRPRSRTWLYLGGAALSLLLLSAGYLLGRPPAGVAEAAPASAAAATAGPGVLSAVLTVLGGTIPAVLLSAPLIPSRVPGPGRVETAIRFLSWQHILVAAAILAIIYVLLFTTFFTNPAGLATGIAGSLSYWLAQQEVERGSQPWFYYPLLLVMYEFLPLALSLAGAVYYLLRRPFRPSAASAQDPGDLGAQVGDNPGDRPGAAGLDGIFVSFLIFWTLASLFIYGWAGEKMPWMVVHQALPMTLLGARFAGDLLERVDWRVVWQRGGGLLILLLPVVGFGLYALAQPGDPGPRLAAALLIVPVLLLVGVLARRLGWRRASYVALATLLLCLSFLTVRFAWLAAYVNYDAATELLVYAHGGADVKPTLDEITAISERTVGDKMIRVAYDGEAAWPLEWYLREYPNRQYYGDTPTREKLDAPVVIANAKIDARVRPFLGQRYLSFKRRQLWWPNQQYMDLTWARIWDILSTSEKRQALWKILYYRDYPRTPDDWYHVNNMYVYLRKDVAQQLWDYGAAYPAAYDLPPDRYAEAHVELGTRQVWGQVGTEPGQFNHPRGIAVGPNGDLYVVDSDNHRVQVFDAGGTFLRQWGSQCNLADGRGCADGLGQGQFQEPWGIAVAPAEAPCAGCVYVADTWNHRVQVFDAGGTFLGQWGSYGQTADDPYVLYGPRDIAVDEQGRVYVTDTGNKRVMVYDWEGNYLHQWGGPGIGPGQFEEPVGIAVDAAETGGASGNLYVVDTWNRRVQVFDAGYTYLQEWPVEGWYGESVVNKPFIAVDGAGRVYVTDPEGYRLAVFTAEGQLLATVGQYGYDDASLTLPTGIDIGPDGAIHLTDTDTHRILTLDPLP